MIIIFVLFSTIIRDFFVPILSDNNLSSMCGLETKTERERERNRERENSLRISSPPPVRRLMSIMNERVKFISAFALSRRMTPVCLSLVPIRKLKKKK